MDDESPHTVEPAIMSEFRALVIKAMMNNHIMSPILDSMGFNLLILTLKTYEDLNSKLDSTSEAETIAVLNAPNSDIGIIQLNPVHLGSDLSVLLTPALNSILLNINSRLINMANIMKSRNERFISGSMKGMLVYEAHAWHLVIVAMTVSRKEQENG
jgi:hypothetical protein